MSSPLKFALTSSSSQPSRLGDSLVFSNTGVGLVGLPVEITHHSEDVRAHEVAIEEQKRAKQICDADRERFRQFYDDELRRKRIKQVPERQQEGSSKTFHTRQGDVQSTPGAVEEQRAKDEKQKGARQICDEDRDRFRQFYDEELRRKRFQQLHSGERQPEGANKTFRPRKGDGKPTRAVQEEQRAKQRARHEQRVKDDQLRESKRLARQRAWQEQRVKDEQLLESYRLAKLRDAELRKLRLRRDEQQSRITHAQEKGYRDDAGIQAFQRHEAALQAQKTQQRSLTEGHIAAFDGILPSFLNEEYQYMKQASSTFPEEITSYNQMRCMRDYQRAISDASRRLPCGLCGGLFQEDEMMGVGL